MLDLMIENGKVVTAKGVALKNIGVKDGKIVSIVSPGQVLSGKKVIDATGMMILPGLVDAHVHAGHGTPDRENFYCASMAAAAGGITTMVEMPLSEPSTVTVEALRDKKNSADEQCVVDYSLYSGVIPGHLDDIEDSFNVGAQVYKAFMCRCSNYPMTYDGALLEGMKKVGELGGMVCVHAENDTLIQELVDKFQFEGKNDIQAYLDSHPEYSELEAINRFIFLAGLVPECDAHICHMSVASGARLLKEAREKGFNNLTCETCPQYLGLNEDTLKERGAFVKCDPPVRSQKNVEELWKYVLDGTIDIITTDHSPHSFEKKKNDGDNFWDVSEGCTGLQTLLPVVMTEGRKRGLTWERLVELCATRPAELFGLKGRKGDIKVGCDADFVFVNPDAEWVLKEEDLFYLNKWSPHTGDTFRGSVVKTLVRGEVVFDKDKILVEKGYGKFYPMDRK